MQESINLTLPPPLSKQFNRLKDQGHFGSDQQLIQAALTSLERQSRDGRIAFDSSYLPYMHRPGLALDDYDT